MRKSKRDRYTYIQRDSQEGKAVGRRIPRKIREKPRAENNTYVFDLKHVRKTTLKSDGGVKIGF